MSSPFYIFVTNGGGIPEADKAQSISNVLFKDYSEAFPKITKDNAFSEGMKDISKKDRETIKTEYREQIKEKEKSVFVDVNVGEKSEENHLIYFTIK